MQYAAVVLFLLLAGCGTWRIELVTMPQPDRIRWEQQITERINQHEHRLTALEEARNAQ